MKRQYKYQGIIRKYRWNCYHQSFTPYMFLDYADKYCDALAKKCKGGNKEACELYEKKCGKVMWMVNDNKLIRIIRHTFDKL